MVTKYQMISYLAEDTAKEIAKNGQEGTNWSNEVVSRAKVQRPEPEKPQKWIIDGTAKVKAKEYKGRDFETVYEISQQIPQNSQPNV